MPLRKWLRKGGLLPRDENVVVFLGAGASHALNTTSPLDSSLLDRIMRRLSQKDNRRESHGHLDAYLSRYFGGRKAQLWDVLMLLDQGIPTDQATRNQLREIIESQICGTALDVMRGGDIGLDRLAATGLATMLSRKWATMTIVTTNYDLVLDGNIKTEINGWGLDQDNRPIGYDWLYSLEGRMKRVYSRRRIDGANIAPELPLIPATGRRAKIIKIHGSVNWGYCPSCREAFLINDPEPGIFHEPSTQHQCRIPGCQQYIRRLFTTPAEMFMARLNMEPYKREVFEHLWQNAEQAILDADNLIFIGYSLPPEDRHVRMWLAKAKALTRRMTNVIVVSNGRDVARRYESVFGGDMHFFDRGLLSFIEENPLSSGIWPELIKPSSM